MNNDTQSINGVPKLHLLTINLTIHNNVLYTIKSSFRPIMYNEVFSETKNRNGLLSDWFKIECCFLYLTRDYN